MAASGLDDKAPEELKSGRATQSEVRLEETLATLISTQRLSAIKN